MKVMNRNSLIYICSVVVALIVGYSLRQPSTGAVTDNGAEVLALVNGRKITRREVDERAGIQINGLEGKLYQLRKTALNEAVADALLEDEAQRTGVSIEELKTGGTPATTVAVTDAQVEKVYANQPERFANVDEATAKQQIRVAIENRARRGSYEKLIAGLKSQGRVEILFRPPTPLSVNVRSDGPFKGSPNAPVMLVEFSDYECPACKNTEAMLKQLSEQYGQKVKLVYRHLPLPMHKNAFGAAQAAFCAGEQGKFWEMHDLLFEQSNGLSTDALKGYAASLGLQSAAFNTCLESDASRAAVSADKEEALAAGIRATPTLILNGKVMTGSRSLEEFKALIDLEIQGGSSRR
jgi:protein-disulfide isomerase